MTRSLGHRDIPAMEELEQRLQDQLSKVRSQKALALRRFAAFAEFAPAQLPPPPAGAAPTKVCSYIRSLLLHWHTFCKVLWVVPITESSS